MGLRETINQRPSLITGITVGVIVVALALIIYTQRSNRPPDRAPGEKPVYIPPAQDKPVDAPPPPGKGATPPARGPGRAAAPRIKKLFAAAAGPATAGDPETPFLFRSTETFA